MANHEGVRCDACMAHDFRGLRYKCLRCDDYDLCPNCFSNGAATGSHTASHPMQCILTANDFAMYHQGESAASSLILGPPRTSNGRDRERERRALAAGIRFPPSESAYANILSGAVPPDRDRRFPHGMLRSLSFTCPICGSLGHTDKSLVAHVFRLHPSTAGTSSSGGPAKDKVEGPEKIICSICASSYGVRVSMITVSALPGHLVSQHNLTAPSRINNAAASSATNSNASPTTTTTTTTTTQVSAAKAVPAVSTQAPVTGTTSSAGTSTAATTAAQAASGSNTPSITPPPLSLLPSSFRTAALSTLVELAPPPPSRPLPALPPPPTTTASAPSAPTAPFSSSAEPSTEKPASAPDASADSKQSTAPQATSSPPVPPPPRLVTLASSILTTATATSASAAVSTAQAPTPPIPPVSAETRATTATTTSANSPSASGATEAQGPPASTTASPPVSASTAAAHALLAHQLQAVSGFDSLTMAVPSPSATPSATSSANANGSSAAPLYMLLPQQFAGVPAGAGAGAAAMQVAPGPSAVGTAGTGGMGMHVPGAPGGSAAIYLLPAGFVPGSSGSGSVINLPPFPSFLNAGMPARASMSHWTSSLNTLLGGGHPAFQMPAFPPFGSASGSANAPLPVPMPAIPMQVQPMFLNAAHVATGLVPTATTSEPQSQGSSANQTASSTPLQLAPTAGASVLLGSVAPSLRTLARIEVSSAHSQQTSVRPLTTDGESAGSRPAPTSQPSQASQQQQQQQHQQQQQQQQQQVDAVALQNQLQLLESQLVQAKHEMERVRAAAANRAATSNEQLEYLQGLDPGLHAHYQALMGLRTAPPAAVSSQPPPAATSAPAPATSSSAARSAPAQPTPAGSYLLKRLVELTAQRASAPKSETRLEAESAERAEVLGAVLFDSLSYPLDELSAAAHTGLLDMQLLPPPTEHAP